MVTERYYKLPYSSKLIDSRRECDLYERTARCKIGQVDFSSGLES